MIASTKKIVDYMLSLNDFKNYRTFETENFIYWIKSSSYYYDNYPVTREEFNKIRLYATKHGTLPSVERRKRTLSGRDKDIYLSSIKNGYKESSNPEVRTNTHSHEVILRYSKKYDSLEYYSYDVEVRNPINSKHNVVIVMKKKRKIFTINKNGCVMSGDNKWLSLKNWSRFHNQFSPSEKVTKLLMQSMLGGKDWVLNLDLNSYMISNKNARKADSLDEAIALECGVKPTKIIQKLMGEDINNTINLYSVIEPNKIHYLTNFLAKNKDDVRRILNNNYQRPDTFLFLYFLSRDNRCDKSILYDYLKMLRDEGKKINLNISSYITIKANHDKLSREILLKKSMNKGTRLKVKKHYPNIKSTPEIVVEKIRAVQRLNEESKILHHCVHSYRPSIDRGHCAIYSLKYEGHSYTLELRATKVSKPDEEDRYEFRANQLKGKYNSNPPLDMKPFLEKMFEDNSIKSIESSYIRFKQNNPDGTEKKDRLVKQIGDKILALIENNGRVRRMYEGELEPIADEGVYAVEHIDYDEFPF
jgi:hypothetical protein